MSDSWTMSPEHVAASPSFWWIRAVELRQAAEDLWNAGNWHDRNPGTHLGTKAFTSWTSPDHVPYDTGGMTRAIAFMLLGLALENIAKGIIVCRDPKRVSRRGLAKWRGKGHDLVALFEEAQIETTPEERQYLALTTELVEWKARYPVPMALVTPKRELAPAEGYVTQWPPTFFAALVGLYAKAGDAMRSTMEAVAPLPRDHPFSER